MSKASEILEARRRQRGLEECGGEWWWFDEDNQQHIHQFSAAWEILRRTQAFRELDQKVRRWRALTENTDERSFGGLWQTAQLISSLREMLPKSPPAPRELCDMLNTWQNMLVNGWTSEKTYLEASKNSAVTCTLPDGKAVWVPPTYGPRNGGVPIILPRQVASSGHTSVSVELCELTGPSGEKQKGVHLAGSDASTEMLAAMHRYGKPVALREGRFIAIQFSLHHPAEAIKALVKTWLDKLQSNKEWIRPADRPDEYSRSPQVLGTLNAFEAIAFFPADQPRNFIERGLGTLIRPNRIAKHLPRIRKEWIQWDFAERLRYAPTRPSSELMKAWDQTRRYCRLVPGSTTRPIRPAQDLANLACADCAPFYRRNRMDLPDGLPLRKDADLNKRIATGRRLVESQDEVFLKLLNSVKPPT